MNKEKLIYPNKGMKEFSKNDIIEVTREKAKGLLRKRGKQILFIEIKEN